MMTEIIRFVLWDWVFLIYCCVFFISVVYDCVTIGVGAADKTNCLGMVGNITSGALHFFMRSILLCFFCCICCQMQCSENPVIRPILVFLSCGLIRNDPSQRKQRHQGVNNTSMNNSGVPGQHNQGYPPANQGYPQPNQGYNPHA